MARIETDPNYTVVTFPRATAATDLFKKEDVQKLAEAMSGHEHGVGKGLPVSRLAPGTIILNDPAITDGAINNAKLQDLTIATPKIADGAITAGKIGTAQVTTNHYVDSSITTPKIAPNATTFIYSLLQAIGPSTTSTTPVLIPSLTVTTAFEPTQIVVLFHTQVYGTAGVGVYFHLRFDGGSWGNSTYVNLGASSASQAISFTGWLNVATSGNHTIEVGWSLGSAGSVTINGAGATVLQLINVKR